MKLLVCGWRGMPRDSKERLREMLLEVTIEARGAGEKVVLVVGGCRGADALAKEIAEEDFGWPVEEYRAEWERYGKAAGPIRNERMIAEGKPDLVVALLHPESRGTRDLVERARRAGVSLRIENVLTHRPVSGKMRPAWPT